MGAVSLRPAKTVLRSATCAIFVFFATFAVTPRAEARLFAPISHWWMSGRLCISARDPPGRAWQTLPPRACAPPDERVAFEIRPLPVADLLPLLAREKLCATPAVIVAQVPARGHHPHHRRRKHRPRS